MALITDRHYSFELIVYTKDNYKITKDNFVIPYRITHWLLSPCHNQDIDNVGNLKAPHYHFICYYSQNVSMVTFLRELVNLNPYITSTVYNCTVNTQTKINRYLYAFHSPLVCKEEDNKFLYNETDIICDTLSVWKAEKEEYDKTYLIIEDIIKGVSPFIMLKKYGRDYVINYEKYQQFAHIFMNDQDSVLSLQGILEKK